MRYLIYTRVSPRGSDWEGDTSCGMQTQVCRDAVAARKGEVANVITDEFYSGGDKNRPGLKSILDSLEDGTAEWDCLIVYKLSRLSRSLKDGTEIFDLLYRQAKGFLSATENLDFSTPSGRAMLGMLHVFNQFEREQSAENTKAKMKSMAAAGLWPVGLPPFGYRRGEKKDNVLKVDERKAMILKDIFESYSRDGRPIDIIKKHGLTQSRLYTILKDPTPLGILRYDGKRYKGRHEAIISQELFDAVQAKLPEAKHSRTRPKAQVYPYLLGGLIKCHCGKGMVPAASYGRSAKYNYYKCVDPVCANRIPAPDLEAAVLDKVRSLRVCGEDIAQICAEMDRRKREHAEKVLPELELARVALRKAEDESSRITGLFVAGVVKPENSEHFNARLSAVNSEIRMLKTQIADLKAVSELDLGVYADAKELADELNSFLYALDAAPDDPEARRRAVLANIHTVRQLSPEGKWAFEMAYGNGASKAMEWYPIVVFDAPHRSFKRKRRVA